MRGTTPIPLPLRPTGGYRGVHWHSLRNEIVHREKAVEGGGGSTIATKDLKVIHISDANHQVIARRVPHPSFTDERHRTRRCPLVCRDGMCAHVRM